MCLNPLIKKSFLFLGLLSLTGLIFTLTSRNVLAAGNPSNPGLSQGESSFAAQGQDQGSLPGGTPVKLAVILQLRNRQALNDLIIAQNTPGSPSYQKFLTPQEFLSAYGPTKHDYDAVAAFLSGNGFTVTTTTNRQLVIAQGTAAQAERAFGTELHIYNYRGRREYANATAPRVPAGLATVIKGVQGLDSSRLEPAIKANTTAGVTPQSSGPAGYTPGQISTAYDYPNQHGYSGSGRTIAVATFADYNDSDVQAFETQFGYSPASLSRVIVGSNPGVGYGGDETTMDIDWSTSLAPGARELVYIAPNDMSDITADYNQIVTDNKADAVTTSWGACEQSWGSAGITQDDGIIEQGAAQGQTWFAAAGDSGSDDCQNGGSGVDYPASSPYVTAMGGTSLQLNASGGIASETVWNNFNIGGGASGGGTSTVESLPAWEYGSPYFANGYRWTSDMAMDGDPYTGMPVYYNHKWGQYGGTSIDAPFASALAAEIGQFGKERLGIFASRINRLANSSSYATVLHDITSGNNGAYQAGTGWDPPSGWGSPDGYKLLLDFGVTRPDLSLKYISAGWGSIDNYSKGLLSVYYQISNTGGGDAFNVEITGAPSTNGVTLSNIVPDPVGNISAGSAATLALIYHVPAGVGSFVTTVDASAGDAVGGSYTYP
ncbi:MAG: S53 family peptidase [Actinobacteria bacterium]|nr:S53 family peptidase [Actinomycetota bacterium]